MCPDANEPVKCNSLAWEPPFKYESCEKGEKLAQCGKEARAAHNHVHTTGSTSYANIRADFEEKNRRDPSELEIFKQTHTTKDETFVKDTLTKDFLIDADTNVDTQTMLYPKKSQVGIENDVFDKLMFGEEVPKCPLGYGFGVNQTDILGA